MQLQLTLQRRRVQAPQHRSQRCRHLVLQVVSHQNKFPPRRCFRTTRRQPLQPLSRHPLRWQKVAAPTPVAAAITGTPLQIAHTIATQAGLNQEQWVCLDSLWYQESKFQTTARNHRSGAFGIPQALPASRMASAGADWRTNPATQVKWGLSYIKVRYGTACNAWAHWKRNRWY